MEKVFYNNRLKKLIAVIILVMLGMNVIAPSITVFNNLVYANSIEDASESERDKFYTLLEEKILEFLEDESTLEYETIDIKKFVDIFLKAKTDGTEVAYNSSDDVVEGRDIWYNSDDEICFLIADRNFLMYSFKYFLREECGENFDDARVLAGNLFGTSNDADYYDIYYTSSTTEFAERTGKDTSNIDDETRIKEKIREWLEDENNTNYGIDNAFTEDGWNTILDWIYEGENGCSYEVDNNGNVTNVVVTDTADTKLLEMEGMLSDGVQSTQEGNEPNPYAGADIGGILLSPVFYLVNFIADAITSNLENIMTGEGLSAFSGFTILQKNNEAMNDLTSTGEIDIAVGSFLRRDTIS